MNISISIDELKRLLTAMPTDQNIMLTGRHGIGKSEILTNFYAERGMKVVTLFLGQMSDPGDLIGLPNKNEQTGKTDFMPPYWFPMDGEPIVLFLDELNRARPEVLQTVMDLVLNRKLAGRQLPKGSVIISAVNEGDEYQLTDLDPALVSRFNIYQFRPTTAEWLLWAQENGLDERVIFFISNNADWLDENIKQADEYVGLEKSPDRRAWKKVSDLIKGIDSLDDYKKFVAGIIGVAATAAFYASVAEKNIIYGKSVLVDFAKVRGKLKSLQLHHLAVINEGIFRCLQLHDYEDSSTSADNLTAYTAWLLNNEKKEAFANFTNLITDSKYSKAVVFISTKTPELYKKVIEFIRNL